MHLADPQDSKPGWMTMEACPVLREPQRERDEGTRPAQEGGARRVLTFLLSRDRSKSLSGEEGTGLCKGLEAEKRAPCGPRLPAACSELPGDLRRRQHDRASVSEDALMAAGGWLGP